MTEKKLCSVDGCEKIAKSKGLCSGHRMRVTKYGNLRADEPLKDMTVKVLCSVEGCGKRHHGHGYCLMHHWRWKNNGNLELPQKMYANSGEGHTNKNGYRRITTPDGRKILEHRYVMEQKIGRKLLKDEDVHHIYGVRDDNRPEMLELWSTSHPRGQRVTDKIRWAKMILERYKDIEEQLMNEEAAHKNQIANN